MDIVTPVPAQMGLSTVVAHQGFFPAGRASKYTCCSGSVGTSVPGAGGLGGLSLLSLGSPCCADLSGNFSSSERMGLRTVPGEADTFTEALTDSARDELWGKGEDEEEEEEEDNDDEDDDDDWDWDDGLGRLTRAHGCSSRSTPQVCCWLRRPGACLLAQIENFF